MVESIKDIPVSQTHKVPKLPVQDSLIDDKDLKGLLFLGVKGNLSAVTDDSEVDFLV
ncbi:MAG: hypothetical protein RBT69_09305 [Spirochaetia bacterium]|nr:hypothetical protein [Spirochaetia bacterium]